MTSTLHNCTLIKLIRNPILKILLLLLLRFPSSLLAPSPRPGPLAATGLIRPNSLHVVTPTIDTLETVPVEVLNVASVARHDQPILLLVHDSGDLGS